MTGEKTEAVISIQAAPPPTATNASKAANSRSRLTTHCADRTAAIDTRPRLRAPKTVASTPSRVGAASTTPTATSTATKGTLSPTGWPGIRAAPTIPATTAVMQKARLTLGTSMPSL